VKPRRPVHHIVRKGRTLIGHTCTVHANDVVVIQSGLGRGLLAQALGNAASAVGEQVIGCTTFMTKSAPTDVSSTS